VPRGRPPKPAAVHALNGNPGKRKRAADTAALAPGKAQSIEGSVVSLPVPPPPAGMCKAARDHWRRMAPILVKRGLLRETDADSFKTLCTLEALRADLERTIAKQGRYYTLNGIVRRHPAVSDLQKTLKDLRDLRDRFGLSPQARARVPAAGGDQLPLNLPNQNSNQRETHPKDAHRPPANPLDAFIAERPAGPVN
jgi:P27 family predicted phage terminase small subunit